MIEAKTIQIDTAALDAFIRELGGNVDKAISALAFDVEVNAKIAAPVDTGALRSSINSRRVSPGVWIVSDGVEYGIYQEYGTHKMAAHPFMIPAVERTAKRIAEKFIEALSK